MFCGEEFFLLDCRAENSDPNHLRTDSCKKQPSQRPKREYAQAGCPHSNADFEQQPAKSQATSRNYGKQKAMVEILEYFLSNADIISNRTVIKIYISE